MSARAEYSAALARAAAEREVQQVLVDYLREIIGDRDAGLATASASDVVAEALEYHIRVAADRARDASLEAGRIAARHPGVVA